MRRKVTIDDELLRAAGELAAREHRTVCSVVNEALRAFLEQPGAATSAAQDGFDLPFFEGSFTVNPSLNAALRNAMESA